MRAALLAPLAVAGCLSAPTGIDRDGGADDVLDAGPDAEVARVWPPDGDVEFAAIATGNFAGNTAEDVIAVNVGDDGTGVFLLVGGVDLDPAAPAVASTYTAYERIDTLTPPVAAAIVEDHVVILDNPSGGARLTVLAGDSLEEVGQFDTGGPAAAGVTQPRLVRLGFGMTGDGTLGIINGDDFRVIEVGDLDQATPDVIAIPAPPGGWGGVTTVGVYDDGGPTFFAGLGMGAYTSPVPMGGAQVWTSERGTNLWPAQLFATLAFDGNDDTKIDLVGFDPMGGTSAAICAVDAIANVSPTCLGTTINDDGGIVLLYDNVAPGIDDDLVVALPGPIGTRIDVFPTLRVVAGVLVSETSPVPQTFVGSNAKLATADIDTAAGPRVILQLAEDGDLTCITQRPEGLERCSD